MNKISFPHDRFFKTAMTQNAVAKSFFAEHLPAFVRDLIDLNTLHLEKESFVTPKLQLFMSDMLFSADFSGNPGYLYLLVEHKSKPARTLPLTLLQYILLILEDHIKKQKKDKKKNRNKKIIFYLWCTQSYFIMERKLILTRQLCAIFLITLQN